MEEVQDTYKDTKIGRIPMDWEVLKLGDIFTFKNGLNKGKEFFGYGIPIVNYMDVYRNEGIYLKDLKGLVHLTTDEINRFNVKKGDVFFTRTSETKEEIGYATVLLEDIKDGVFSGFILRARTESTKLNLLFRKYCFSSSIARSQIYATSSISTRALTNGGSLSLVRIPLPPLPEQQKIAEILSTVDGQISTTQAIIDKSKELKKGLMQKLFSEGIGHTEFKDTKIGRIPKDWEVVNVRDIVDTGSGGTPLRTNPSFYNDGSIPWLKTGELSTKYLFDSEEKITELAIQNSSAKLFPSGSILIAMYGATIGKISIIKQSMSSNQACCALYPSAKVNQEYLYYSMLNSKKILISKGVGGAQPNISQQIIKIHQVPLPSAEEQQKIADILSEADKKIEREKQCVSELEQLKKGLMQQLLTGQKRVKV